LRQIVAIEAVVLDLYHAQKVAPLPFGNLAALSIAKQLREDGVLRCGHRELDAFQARQTGS
jgi:hypothetical protein